MTAALKAITADSAKAWFRHCGYLGTATLKGSSVRFPDDLAPGFGGSGDFAPRQGDFAWVRCSLRTEYGILRACQPFSRSGKKRRSGIRPLCVSPTGSRWSAFLALLISGMEIVISHPRFYWGETGNSGTAPLFNMPIPASRETVPTGYNYVMPDQNGWSRYLHFEAAWVLVLTGLVYGSGAWSAATSGATLFLCEASGAGAPSATCITKYLRRAPPDQAGRAIATTCCSVPHIWRSFSCCFPLIIWTGLAMSPSFIRSFSGNGVDLLGGRQIGAHASLFPLLGCWSFSSSCTSP